MLIGTGSFAQGTVAARTCDAPAFSVTAVASASGRSAYAAKERFAVDHLMTPDEVLDDPAIDAVAVVTRHATHAAYAVRRLEER